MFQSKKGTAENSKVCACILLAAVKSREGKRTRGGGCCPVVVHIQEVLSPENYCDLFSPLIYSSSSQSVLVVDGGA